MLEPATANLPPIQRGGTYELALRLYQDAAKTIPLNLSSYTPALIVQGVGALGLTVKGTEGELSFTIASSVSNALPEGGLHFVLWLEQEAGSKRWPIMDGTIPVETP